MKTLNGKKPIQVASNVIKKSQEIHGFSLETLQKAQVELTNLKQKLIEKDNQIVILSTKLKRGANSFLESSNREKDVRIKQLNLQIEKLIREKRELENELSLLNAGLCSACENMQSNNAASASQKPTSNTIRKQWSKNTQSQLHNNGERVKTLEKIIEYKDNRISSLSKVVTKLTEVKKDLTDKVSRLSKLLPFSHLSSEAWTDQLLKEIRSLEMELQLYKEKYDKLHKKVNTLNEVESKLEHDNKETMLSNDTVELDASLISNLKKLYKDICDLKNFITNQDEELKRNMSQKVNKIELLQSEWSEIRDKLSEVMNSIHKIVELPEFPNNLLDESQDERNVIKRLQERLKGSLNLITQYEAENIQLRESINVLTAEIEKFKTKLHDGRNGQHGSPRDIEYENVQESHIDMSNTENVTKTVKSVVACTCCQVQEYKARLNALEKEKELLESHLKTTQTLCEQYKKAQTKETVNMTATAATTSLSSTQDDNLDAKSLQTKLSAAEKSIQSYAGLVERLMASTEILKSEKIQLETELMAAKSQSSEDVAKVSNSLSTQIKSLEEELSAMKNQCKELEEKVQFLENEKAVLQESLTNSTDAVKELQNVKIQKVHAESKLEISEKKVRTLEDNVHRAQTAMEKLKIDNADLIYRVQILEAEKAAFDAQDDEVTALRNELALKEDEVNNLKDSIQAYESKAYEMKHYRRSLRKEINKLCDRLLEKSDSTSSESRKVICEAAVLKFAQALLQFDEDFNLEEESEPTNQNALDEMKHQVSVYLAEVARIHELLTIREKERDNLLKEYFNLSVPSGGNRASFTTNNQARTSSATTGSSSDFQATTHPKTVDSLSYRRGNNTDKSPDDDTNSLVSYLLNKCTQLEDLIQKERSNSASYFEENEKLKKTVQELRTQLSAKNSVSKQLKTIVEMNQKKEHSNDIRLEQMKTEIQWLISENQKLFEKTTATQSELCKVKEENTVMTREISNLRRELVNEKYERAKLSNSMKKWSLTSSSEETSKSSDMVMV